MVRLKSKEYSGYLDTSHENAIVAVISTTDLFADIAAQTQQLAEVVETDSLGNETSYVVTRPLGIQTISPGMYAVHLSTKPTETQALEQKIQEQNTVIDELLAAILEGV